MNESWPENKVLRLMEYRKSGWAYSDIAAEMHVTRNAVIGKCHRLGLCRAKEPGEKKTAKQNVERIKPVVKDAQVATKKIAITDNVMAETANDNADPHMWVFRDDYLCKWPGTDRKTGPVFECDKTRVFGKPYCRCHWQKSISPTRK